MSKTVVQSSPHVTSSRTVANVMLDVIIALIPCLAAGTLFFGVRALLTVSLCVLSTVGSEALYNLICKRKQTVGDLSAVVTGLILGMNLPSHVPVYLPVVGGVFAIVLVKMLFGGIGKNFANPAAAARLFLLLAYTSAMTKFVIPHSGFSGYFSGFSSDVTSGATYLSGGNQTLVQLFFGNVAGCIGETSVLCILLGAAYLLIRGVIDWRIPLCVVLSSAFFTAVFDGTAKTLLSDLCAGGLMFGAVFMATDYATSPKTSTGRIIYACGIGLIATLIRRFGSYPEGLSFAIVLMNIIVPFIDRWIVPVRFGQNRKSITRIVAAGLAAAMAVTVGVFSCLCVFAKKDYAHNTDIIEKIEVLEDGTFVFESEGKLDGTVYLPDASWADPTQPHYSGSVWLRVAVKDDVITQISYLADTLHGAKVTENDSITADSFAPYIGKSIAELQPFRHESDIVAGATYTSNAIHNAVYEVATAYKGVKSWSVFRQQEFGAVTSLQVKEDGTYVLACEGMLDGTVYLPDASWADPTQPHYSGSVWLSVAVKDGVIMQISYLADTLHGAKVTENDSVTENSFAPYIGKSIAELQPFRHESDIVAGATYTSNAIHNAVRTAAYGYVQAGGAK